MALIYGILAVAAGRPVPAPAARRAPRRRAGSAGASPRRVVGGSLLASSEPHRRRARRRRADRRHRRGARRRRVPARALPVGAGGRRRRAAADPGAAVPARRVRQRRARAHEHGLQGRLPGVPAARPGRGLRAAVGRRVAPAPRLAAVGGGRWPSCSCSGSSTPTRAATRAPAATPTRPTLDGLKWLRVALTGRPGGDGLDPREHRRRRGGPRGLRRRLQRVRPRPHLHLHAAARP